MSELDRVRELLAFHAQGVLIGDDLAFMIRWLELHSARHPEITAELTWLRNTATQLRSHADGPIANQPEDAGLNALMKRIAQETDIRDSDLPFIQPATRTLPDIRSPLDSQASCKASWASRTGRWLADAVGIRSPTVAFGLMAVVIGQACVIGVLLTDPPASQMPLSATPTVKQSSPSKIFLTVAFRPQATEQVIRETLASASAQIVAGPSALGLYIVTIPDVSAAVVAAQLLAAHEVVESVQR